MFIFTRSVQSFFLSLACFSFSLLFLSLLFLSLSLSCSIPLSCSLCLPLSHSLSLLLSHFRSLIFFPFHSGVGPLPFSVRCSPFCVRRVVASSRLTMRRRLLVGSYSRRWPLGSIFGWNRDGSGKLCTESICSSNNKSVASSISILSLPTYKDLRFLTAFLVASFT